jgi:Na+/H+ antiporter NhaD/arsenite permease-like protein
LHAAPFLPSPAWVAPFLGLLVAIAVLPLVAARFWESNLRKLAVSAALGLPVLGLYALQAPATLGHAALDYVSFIVMLGSLFIVSGGVVMQGDLKATPGVNSAFLGVGALLASFVGTTGASMLLIRPLLGTNSQRRHVTHTVVFYIFLVSNIGGCLTPLGDPPLFLGYLAGVPFTWTLRLFPAWLAASLVLLAFYWLWDTWAYERESRSARARDLTRVEPLRVRGGRNAALLLAIVASVALLEAPYRELAMVAASALSLRVTPAGLRQANHFSFHPILEVAALFAGIFVTMLPALDLLRARGAELGVREPWQFFWATGLLSSFLDNAPTYLTFLALAQGLGLPPDVVGVSHEVLAAISLGAVFMGANTYIGNGPNFMVRAIAEERGVRMPSFAGYMLYSSGVLLPLFLAMTVVFFR